MKIICIREEYIRSSNCQKLFVLRRDDRICHYLQRIIIDYLKPYNCLQYLKPYNSKQKLKPYNNMEIFRKITLQHEMLDNANYILHRANTLGKHINLFQWINSKVEWALLPLNSNRYRRRKILFMWRGWVNICKRRINVTEYEQLLENYVQIIIFTNPSARAGYDTRLILSGVLQDWILSFPSPRLVASPRLKDQSVLLFT